jgi:hypothetical protein
MRFKLPKPLHGWREFVGEVGIIVLGVLIALGAQQIVENFHDAAVKRETVRVARAEVAAALGDFVNRRLLEPCIDRRLDEVSNLLSASQKPDYRAPSWIGRPQYWGFDTSGWDAATAGGRVALLDPGEQSTLGGIYAQLRNVILLEGDEQKAWAEIRQLENLPVVDTQTRASVRSALAQARLVNWNIRVDLEMPLAQAEKMGIVRNLAPRRASPSICLPLTTPRAEAIRRVNTFFGDNLGEP